MKQIRNKGGRPAKSKAQKQDYSITIRLDTELNFRLKALARESGWPRTETVRQLIAHGCVKECIRREHLDFMFQLKGIARNLNQLTRLAHAKGFTGVIARHTAIVANIEVLLRNLRNDR